MVDSLLTPEQILTVIPGRVTFDGTVDNASDNGLAVRGYRFDKTDVSIPSMRDYKLVRWKSEASKLGFYNGNRWIKQSVSPGDVTILARGEPSRWFWMEDIDVSHVYVSQSAVERVANDIFDKEIDHLNIEHIASAQDPILIALMESYERECLAGGLGGALYASTIEMQICIHLVRKYAKCKLREVQVESRIPPSKRKKIEEFIVENIDQNITIDDLAKVVGFSQSYFIRLFRNDVGVPPHAYVLARRLEKAEEMLRSSPDIPIKVVAIECGFSDQSHLTRLFKNKFSITPMKFRKVKTSKVVFDFFQSKS